MVKSEIPPDVIAVVSDVLGAHYYSHTKLNNLFIEAGAPPDPPCGNCVEKCAAWLKMCNAAPEVDAFGVLGGVLCQYMERAADQDHLKQGRDRIERVLGRNGLSYAAGRVVGATVRAPVHSLQYLLKSRDLSALEREVARAIAAVESDPAAGLTAACALVEAFCKVYIADEGLPLPSHQTVKELWKVVSEHLGLDPANIADADVKRVLSGLSSIVDGIGAFRTHAGSAHGRGRDERLVEPRHARLAIHAAHTITTFLLETWEKRKASGCGG